LVRLNICPLQGSRTIRTEEAVLLGLARLNPYITHNVDEIKKTSVIYEKDKEMYESSVSDESSYDK